MLDREKLGRIVRATWVECATGQPDPKPSWLLPWEMLDEFQRDADCQMGLDAAREGQAELVRWLRCERADMERRANAGRPEDDDQVRAMQRANQAATATAITSVLAMLAVYRPEIPHA
jgi:hypothetical protein